MKQKVIKNNKEHRQALSRLESLIELSPRHGSEEDDELSLLSVLVSSYERTRYPLTPPDPIDAIVFRMDQMGLSRKDMVPYFGTISRVSEVLSGKRRLSLAMIRKLNEGLGIPADILIRAVEKRHPVRVSPARHHAIAR